MKYQETAFYRFGLAAGAASFLRNGFTPGFREAASGILQPVNSYTRFPEYHFMERAVAGLIQKRGGDQGPLRILDIGSPKLFGFYLARRYNLDLLMTDISPLNIIPIRKMWDPLSRRARGRARFEFRDARRLTDAAGTYDAVYAMSVLEHVEGDGGDSAAVLEMARVLKPGGLLMFSVPFGPVFQSQVIRGVAHSVERTRKENIFFFQRIYDRIQAEERLLRPLRGRIEGERAWTVDRRSSALLRGYHHLRGSLPESVMTALGFLNPVMSAALNRHRPGIAAPEAAAYGSHHRFGDIYGDLIFTARRNTRPFPPPDTEMP
jgi:SAM-dependent methyltransferase